MLWKINLPRNRLQCLQRGPSHEKTCVPFFLSDADLSADCVPFHIASVEYVKEAVAEDNAGNYQKAFDLYKIALEYFSTHLKYEKNPRAKEAITAKVRDKHTAYHATLDLVGFLLREEQLCNALHKLTVFETTEQPTFTQNDHVGCCAVQGVP